MLVASEVLDESALTLRLTRSKVEEEVWGRRPVRGYVKVIKTEDQKM